MDPNLLLKLIIISKTKTSISAITECIVIVKKVKVEEVNLRLALSSEMFWA